MAWFYSYFVYIPHLTVLRRASLSHDFSQNFERLAPSDPRVAVRPGPQLLSVSQ